MNRTHRIIGWLALLLAVGAFTPRVANAQPTISNPRVIAVNINGRVSGTINTTFVFRAEVVPSSMQILTGVWVYIDPTDQANPEQGFWALRVPMVRDGLPVPPNAPNGFKACIVGSQIAPEVAAGLQPSATHTWSIVASDTGTGGTPPGFSAAPKPAAPVDVYTTQIFQIMPVDENRLPDKRLIPGQPGNGLRMDPIDPTSPNDGGAAHIFTWRVRVRNVVFPGGLPQGGISPQFFLQRSQQEWRDVRGTYDSFPPFVARYNSAVMLVLISPDGTRHFCPMEIDPDAPGQGGLQAALYPLDPILNQQFFNVNGSNLFRWDNSGVFYRFRMVPSQYIFNHGPIRGEGPFTAFGGPTMPDSIPAIPVGWGAGADGETWPPIEVIGRPFAVQYSGFAGPDRNPFAPAFPFYTDVLNRSGQWKYYYMCTADLRPPTRGGFPDNFRCDVPFFPDDLYGSDPNAYFFNFDSDTGPAPGDPSQPYIHPFITPMLSDGGWTDDIPENGWGPPFGISSSSHRSRVTTKTRVRFIVRATQPDNNRPPLLVRVFIDGTSPANSHPMQILPIPGNNDYTKGVVYFWDTTFTEGQQGPHWVSFEADDGLHKAIWPRRDTSTNGTGDSRYFDGQALFALSGAKGDATDFGTGAIGMNFFDEPMVNTRSVLSNPLLTPPSGSEGQPFTYEVNFFDADGDEPLDSIVNIDGIDHRMSAVTSVPTNTPGGRKYRFVLNALAPTLDSTHTYYFKFRDNWNSPNIQGRYNISPIRREFGEWVTLPQGDDLGNPSDVIHGPTIVSNHTPELTDATFTFSDPAQTSATLYDFVVRYKDADNNPPSTIKVYLSKDNGATWPIEFSLVKAENNNNYTAGVQYHLPTRTRLAVGTYCFKFIANDSIVDQTLIHVGTGSTAITNGSAHTLSTTDNVNFIDPQGTKFKQWSANPSDTWVWLIRGGVTSVLNAPGDYVLSDPVNGVITLASPAQPGDVYKASYFYLKNVGPTVKVNTVPTLTSPIANPPGDPNTNDGTLTPKSGSSAQSFTYSIKYSDADNQPPTYVNVVIDTNTTKAMVMDPATPTPVDYTRGVKYNVTVLGSDIGNGTHTYHFEASDGADLARFPAPPNDLSGPTIADIGDLHLPPFSIYTDKAIVPFPKGKSTDNYLFTVVYQNSKGLAPQFPIELRIKDNATGITTSLVMNPIDPVGPNEYIQGVRYQMQITAPNPPLNIGQHDVTFGFQTFGAATPTLTLTVNGPPVLSLPITPANGSSYSQAADVIFSVKYTDPNDDPPTIISVVIDQGTPNQRTITLTPVPGQPQPLNYTTGVTFQAVVPGGPNSPPSLAVGAHSFHFISNDGTEDSNIIPAPDWTVTIVPAQPPVLSEPSPGTPATNNGTLTPTSGARSAQYTYAVKYTHPQGVAPVNDAVQLFIDNQAPINMTRPPGPVDYAAGVIYSFTTAPNFLAAGAHTYFFQAADRISTARLPVGTGTYAGPTLNFPPTLTNGTVQVVGGATSTINAQNVLTPAIKGNVLTNMVFQVVYTDADNVAPGPGGYVRLVIDGGSPVTLTATGTLNYGAGVSYVSSSMGLSPGQHTFHFEASDGLDPARLPATGEVSGISIANLPILEAINPSGDDGTLTPRLGPLSTTFTYKIKYRHPDNTGPASVKVFIDGQAFNMTKLNATTNYAAGEVYVFTYRFPSGTNHNYRFEAVDTVSPSYTAYYPGPGAGNTIAGPTINLPVFNQPSFNPNPGIAGQPMTIGGQLVTNTQFSTVVSVKLIRPDGTGFNQSVNTNIDGTFQVTFTPDQTGDWKVEFSWAGQTGVYDPITTQFPFRVTGFSLALNSGELDMISPTIVPVTPDPSITLGVQDTGGNPLSVTELNLIKWVPSAGTGRYFILNLDATFPGMTGGQSYWVRPNQSLSINPRGKLWDQTQSYEIPLTNGWNMIGTVYLQDTSWGATKVRFQGQLIPLSQAGNIVRPIAWTYDKGTGGYALVDSVSGMLRTGRGYWVRALQDCSIVIAAPGQARSVEVTRDAVDRSASIQIMARSGNRSDQDNFVEMSGTTASRLALMEKPPYIGDYVSVRLLDPAKVDLPADTRAATTGQTIIPFQVETDRKNADVTVQFPNFSTIGRKYEVSLLDLASKSTRAIGTSGAYSFNSGDATNPRRFALLVSPRSLNTGIRITDLRASNPLGRAGGTTFTFALSSSGNIRAQIIGGTGTVIRDLAQGRAATRGANTLIWDGKNSQGIAVPSGTYTMKLTASDDSAHQVTAFVPITLVR